MRKRIALLVSVIAALSVSSCSGNNNPGNRLKIAGINLDDGYGYNFIITKFQEENPDINIEIVDYASDGNWRTGMEKFNASVVTKDCGDILLCNAYTDVENLADKNILADMYQCEVIKNKKDSIISSVLESCEIDNGLYSIYPSFSVNAYVCRSSDVSVDCWNMEGFTEIAEKLYRDDKNFLAGRSENAFQTMFCGMIDYVNNNSSIENSRDSLVKILEDMKQLNDISRDNKSLRGERNDFRENKVVASEEIIDNFDSYWILEKGIAGEDIALLGMPEEKNELVINPDLEVALFENSKSNDCALRFIEYILSDEVQKMVACNLSGFPVTSLGMQQMKNLALSENIYDENGNYAEKKDTKYYFSENECVDIGIPKESDINKIYKTICSAKKIQRKSMALRDVVSEVLAPYWNDEISADKAFDSLISAYSLYNSEKN